MNRFAVLLLALPVAACSGERAEPSASESAAASVASAAETASSESPAADASGQSAPASRYTSLKACKVVEDGGGEDWSVSRCEGTGGYALIVDYSDARDDLQIVRKDQTTTDVDLFKYTGGGFNALADTVEWRGNGEGEGFVPRALIVRNQVSEDPAHSERSTAILTVIDLERACVTALVRPKADQNEEARAIADIPQRPCLKP